MNNQIQCDKQDIPQNGINEPFSRPVDARAVVEYASETLTIIVPSEISGKSPGLQRFIVAYVVFFGLFICGYGGWMTYACLYGCRIFWKAFDFWQALGCTMLLFGIIIVFTLTMVMMPLMTMCSQLAHSRLVLSKTEIHFEFRAWFQKQVITVPNSSELVATLADRKLINRQQLTLRYWLVHNPALGQRHIRINTEPPIVLPFANENELCWLLLVLNEFFRRNQPEESFHTP